MIFQTYLIRSFTFWWVFLLSVSDKTIVAFTPSLSRRPLQLNHVHFDTKVLKNEEICDDSSHVLKSSIREQKRGLKWKNKAAISQERNDESSKSSLVQEADISKMDANEMIALKIKQWKVLAETGALEKLAKTIALSNDDIDAFDASANMIFRERGVPLIPNPRNQIDLSIDTELMAKRIKSLDEKFSALNKKDELALFNMFLEMRDQKVDILSEQEGFQLFMKILDSFVKLPLLLKESLNINTWYSKLQKILQSCVQLIVNDNDSETNAVLSYATLLEDVEYWESFTRKLAQSAPLSHPNIFHESISYLLEHDLVRDENLSISKFMWQLRELSNTDNGVVNDKSQILNVTALSSLFTTIVEDLGEFSLSGVNELIKYLGLMGLRDEMFTIYTRMEYLSTFQMDKTRKQSHTHYPHLRPNAETLEMLATGLLLPVQEEHSSLSMKDLPSIVVKEKLDKRNDKVSGTSPKYVPEVILLGRSNVGKSSLTNILLNRKNLAPVSATPGFTQAFHFFTLSTRALSPWNRQLISGDPNKEIMGKDRNEAKQLSIPPRKSQLFRIVDMPGLGFAANVTDGKQSSWKSLLQRYLLKRETVRSVLHLIDIRHPLTPTDKEILSLVYDAAVERLKIDLQPFHYGIVLTKQDKCKSSREIAATKSARIKEIEEFLHSLDEKINNNTAEYSTEQEKQADKHISMLKPTYVSTSSLNKQGIDKLWQQILEDIQAL